MEAGGNHFQSAGVTIYGRVTDFIRTLNTSLVTPLSVSIVPAFTDCTNLSPKVARLTRLSGTALRAVKPFSESTASEKPVAVLLLGRTEMYPSCTNHVAVLINASAGGVTSAPVKLSALKHAASPPSTNFLASRKIGFGKFSYSFAKIRPVNSSKASILESVMITRNLEEVKRQENEIRNHIHRQILGISDQVRSKEIWQRILAAADPEAIANALTVQLTHFNYQALPVCENCKKYV